MSLNILIANVIQLYEIVLIVRIILSWVPHDRHHPAVQLLYRITEPILGPARRIIPPLGGTLDISPILVFVALEMLKRFFMGG